MKARQLLLAAAGLLVSAFAEAQTLKCDLDFQYLFDNWELDSGGKEFKPSGTLSGAVFTPWLGIESRGMGASHSLMAGAEFFRHSGQSEKRDVWTETMFYWKSELALEHGGIFTGAAGIYPRSLQKGRYSRAFLSEETEFTDRNLEGMLLQWDKPGFFAELGLDWMGRKEDVSREKFQVYSAGEYSITEMFSIGWTAAMFHLASSNNYHSVVDNSLVEPWVRMDFIRRTGSDELSLTAGALVAYQRDRLVQEKADIPFGGELTFVARKNHVELRNDFYMGGNLFPLYGKYGMYLYEGDAFYGVNAARGMGFFDRLDIAYVSNFNSIIRISAGASFYAGNTGYLGWQQKASLIFNFGQLNKYR